MGVLSGMVLTAGMAVAGALGATVDGSDPLSPVLTLTNSGTEACQIAPTALGTIAVTAVEQGGEQVVALPVDVAFDDGPRLQERLTTLDPGTSTEIALPVVDLGDGQYALEAVSWSEAAGPYGALYPVRSGEPVLIVLTYTVPVQAADGPAVCPPVTAVVEGAAHPGNGQPRWILYAAVGAGAVLLLVLVLVLVLTRRHRSAAAGLILLASVVAVASRPAAARAVFHVSPDLQEQFDACVATFRDAGDPAGILPTLEDPKVNIEIIPARPGDSHTDVLGPNHSLILWDPNDTHTYYGSGGDADGCTALYHEMHHALQGHDGTWSREPCTTTDARGRTLEKTEVLATHAQNSLRRALGMPERDHYGDIPLPADCKPPDDPKRCTGEHCGDSNGDPHLRTYDGRRYDFQGAGEFVLTRSTGGDFEVQVRQEPPHGHTQRLVTLNTAVAMMVDGTRVEFRSGDWSLGLLIDGEERESASTGPVTFVDRTAVVEWEDGSTAYVRPIGPWGLHVAVAPAGVNAGSLEGLLGDFDLDPDNDLRQRDGESLDEPTYEALYPDFAESWRVDAASSLFTYDPGTGPETYVDRTYPDRRTSIDELPNRDAAEALCRSRGITEPDVLTGCVLDVALTGLPDFADAAAGSQAIPPIRDFGGVRYDVAVTEPGTAATVTFEGTAGQQVFVDIPITTLPGQCGGLEIRDPDDQRVGSSGCIINGDGFIDATTLPVTGRYTIVVDPPGDHTGEARLMLITFTDQNANITTDGRPVTSTVDKPGVVSRFTFDGAAGQRVFVDLPSSTLPGQCGGFYLAGPDGARVGDSGCIVNGDGYIDTATLPEDGTYAIVLDPNGSNVGETEVRLYGTRDQSGAVSVNGTPTHVDLTTPGSEASFTFAATAGQRIVVELTDSTLPNQCGGYNVTAPSGTRIVDFCMIAGEGKFPDDGEVLPESGTYTITIDPGGSNSGEATLRVRTV